MSKTIAKAKSVKKIQKVVHLTIYDKLQAVIKIYQDKYPLLADVSIIKMLLSKGIKQTNL